MFSSVVTLCQWENQVPNYSFENVTNNYPSPYSDGFNTPDCGFFTGAATYDDIVEYWGNVINWTHPLKKEICLECPRVATADLLSTSFLSFPNEPRSGQNWGKTVKTGEYLIVPTLDFSGGLKPTKTYFIEVFHKGNAIEDLDVVGYESQPKICGFESNKSLHEVNANSGHADVFFSFNASNSSGWTRYRDYFSPNSFKNWLSFGNTGEWDDLRIYEVQNNKCKDNWYFDNTVFNYPMEVFQASNNIYVGNGVDPENGSNHIPGDVVQYANTKVILRAKNQVVIDQATFANNAGPENLIIENAPCGDDLCPDELEFENEVLCNQSSAVIGTEGNDWGTSVQWTPSTNLSNPNVANPVFTAPGQNGSITYEVEVTYTCDASEIQVSSDPPSFSNSYTETHEVVVQYVDPGDPSASISANVLQDDAYNFETDLTFSDGVTEITIEINSPPGYSQTFYAGDDFTCCNFNWELPAAWAWSSCKDDIVKITARNRCSGEEKVIQLPWNKSNVPFSMPSSYPNGVSANNDGINDELCFDIESADQYDIVITDLWGNPIWNSSGPVIDNPHCIYAPPLEDRVDGTYFYLIEFSDDCGNVQESDQFFHLYTPKNKSTSIHQEERDNIDGPMDYISNRIVLSPNPTASQLTISGIDEVGFVEVFDKNGKSIKQVEVKNNTLNVQGLSTGTYFCKFSVNGFPIVKSFVKI